MVSVSHEVRPYHLATYDMRWLVLPLCNTHTHVLTSSNEEGVLRLVIPVLCCSIYIGPRIVTLWLQHASTVAGAILDNTSVTCS